MALLPLQHPRQLTTLHIKIVVTDGIIVMPPALWHRIDPSDFINLCYCWRVQSSLFKSNRFRLSSLANAFLMATNLSVPSHCGCGNHLTVFIKHSHEFYCRFQFFINLFIYIYFFLTVQFHQVFKWFPISQGFSPPHFFHKAESSLGPLFSLPFNNMLDNSLISLVLWCRPIFWPFWNANTVLHLQEMLVLKIKTFSWIRVEWIAVS